MTRAKMEEFNPFGIVLNNAFLNRTPNYYVYIYNVSDIQHRIERPWAHPAVIIPPCEEGEAYSRPFIIPDIVAEVQPTVGGRVSLAVNGTDGKFLAQDALHPEHPTGDWQTYIKANVANSGSFGTDLYGLGCWWSLNQDPEVDSDEVVTARQRLEATYEGLIEQATQFSLEGEDGRKKITHMMHRAANYFHLETPVAHEVYAQGFMPRLRTDRFSGPDASHAERNVRLRFQLGGRNSRRNGNARRSESRRNRAGRRHRCSTGGSRCRR